MRQREKEAVLWAVPHDTESLSWLCEAEIRACFHGRFFPWNWSTAPENLQLPPTSWPFCPGTHTTLISNSSHRVLCHSPTETSLWIHTGIVYFAPGSKDFLVSGMDITVLTEVHCHCCQSHCPLNKTLDCKHTTQDCMHIVVLSYFIWVTERPMQCNIFKPILWGQFL